MVAPRRRFLSPALIVRRNAFTKGVLGNEGLWRAVAVVVVGRSLLKRFLGRTEEIVTVERLAPGQSMLLRTIAPPSRRERRRARGAAS